MVVTEFLKLTADGLGQEKVATLTVHDDGTHTISGDPDWVPTDVGILLEHGRLTFEDDPAAWARSIGTELRTPYLTARVVEDQ